jgi:Domain of unknown function (DUF5615)
MSKLRLHLDADTSIKALHQALTSQGHDATRTPMDWMPLDASDDIQLQGATTQKRCIFTFNIRDFIPLSQQNSSHYGILLAAQSSWTLSELIAALNRLLSDIEAEDMIGQVRWLNEWKA